VLIYILTQGCGVKNDPVAPAGSKPLDSSIKKYTAKPILLEEKDKKQEQKDVPGLNESQ
jgi:hypothetical protein